MNLNKIGRRLGPGILFAASSVGTSHLVQSTRAGADYGLMMWGIILFAMFVRYPAYRFGAEYAAATGRTLIDSYFRQGRWAITIFSIEVLVNMFIATAAIALVTSGI
jgi:Mn2+/Fe2+ NRAMP family transporter